MGSQGYPFDDEPDINLFEDAPLIEELDLEFPVTKKSGLVNRTFLLAGGFMILAMFFSLIGIVVLLLSGDSKPVPPMVATLPYATTRAIETAIAATQTRSAILDFTGIAVTERLNRNATNTAIVRASDTVSAVNQLLDGSRTAIGYPTTSYQETQKAAYWQTITAVHPRVLQAQILDFNGNPVTGIIIQIYQDNGDGLFNSPSPTFTKAG